MSETRNDNNMRDERTNLIREMNQGDNNYSENPSGNIPPSLPFQQNIISEENCKSENVNNFNENVKVKVTDNEYKEIGNFEANYDSENDKLVYDFSEKMFSIFEILFHYFV